MANLAKMRAAKRNTKPVVDGTAHVDTKAGKLILTLPLVGITIDDVREKDHPATDNKEAYTTWGITAMFYMKGPDGKDVPANKIPFQVTAVNENGEKETITQEYSVGALNLSYRGEAS